MVVSCLLLAISALLVSCHYEVYNNNSIVAKNNINKVNMSKNDTGNNVPANDESVDEDSFKLVSKPDIDFLIQAIKLEQKSNLIELNSKIIKLKQKYPFVLVGNTDYGILKEPDLWFYEKYDRKIDPNLYHDYSDEREEFYYATGNHAYWQCFPKENIQITLTEYSPSDDEPKASRINYKNPAKLNLLIYVFIGNFITQTHYYKLGNYTNITVIKNILNIWDNMLLHEDYLCLGGIRSKNADRVNHSTVQSEHLTFYEYYWDLYDIKTKHGCYGYTDNCKSRLQKFQQYLKKGKIE